MFKLLYICATILLLFPYQLLLTKIEVVFPKFAVERVYIYIFFVFTLVDKIRLVRLKPN